MLNIFRNLMVLVVLFSNILFAEESNYKIGAGDTVKVVVYNNPDLDLETRVSESGFISYPLVGEVAVAGETTFSAEKKIASLLKSKGYIKEAYVNIFVTKYQSQLVSVLGGVNRPGQYTLERDTTLTQLLALAGGANSIGSDTLIVTNKNGTQHYDLKALISSGKNDVKVSGGDVVYVNTNEISVMGQVNRPGKFPKSGNVRTVSDFLALAGGASAMGGDSMIVKIFRNGNLESKEINIQSLYDANKSDQDIELQAGDSIFVPKAPIFYIYGEVQKPGSFRLEQEMTVMQALAQGGGPTIRGTDRGLKLHRKDDDGSIKKLTPSLTESVMPNDVIYVEESIF